MNKAERSDIANESSAAARVRLAAFRELLDEIPVGQPEATNLKDAFACTELALTFYEKANRAVQAEVWFAAAVAAAALEAILLARMFMSTSEVGKLKSFSKLLDQHKRDFGSFARKEMDLGKLLAVANS